MQGAAIRFASAVSIDGKGTSLAVAFPIGPLRDPKCVSVFVFAAAFDSSIQPQSDDSRAIAPRRIFCQFADRKGPDRQIDFVAKNFGGLQSSPVSAKRGVRKKPSDASPSSLEAHFPAAVTTASGIEIDPSDIASRFRPGHACLSTSCSVNLDPWREPKYGGRSSSGLFGEKGPRHRAHETQWRRLTAGYLHRSDCTLGKQRKASAAELHELGCPCRIFWI